MREWVRSHIWEDFGEPQPGAPSLATVLQVHILGQPCNRACCPLEPLLCFSSLAPGKESLGVCILRLNLFLIQSRSRKCPWRLGLEHCALECLGGPKCWDCCRNVTLAHDASVFGHWPWYSAASSSFLEVCGLQPFLPPTLAVFGTFQRALRMFRRTRWSLAIL